jgi:hypothetical protein
MVTRSIDYQGRDRNSLGMVFRVLTVEPSPLGNPCWTYEGPRQVMRFEGQTWRIDSIADACLTPLRGDVRSAEVAMSSNAAALRRIRAVSLTDAGVATESSTDDDKRTR